MSVGTIVVEREPISPSRPMRFFFVRHGEQTAYEQSESVLTEYGEDQVRLFALQVLKQIQMEQTPQIINIMHSSRERTTQSAEIFYDIAQNATQTYQLQNVHSVIAPVELDILQRADTLHNLLDNTYIRGLAKPIFHIWQTEFDFVLEMLGSVPPSKLSAEMQTYLHDVVQPLALFLGNGPKINHVFFTHEPTLYAVLYPHRYSFWNPEENVVDFEHTEAVVVTLDENPCISFRGMQVPINSEVVN